MKNSTLSANLSTTELEDLTRLKEAIKNSKLKHGRNKSTTNFQNILEILKQFCIVGGEQDQSKCLACGICFLSSTEIATSSNQLKNIFGFSKANINVLFNESGYKTVEKTPQYQQQLLEKIPFLKTKAFIAKQWTIRKKAGKCCSCIKPDEATKCTCCTKCKEEECGCCSSVLGKSCGCGENSICNCSCCQQEAIMSDKKEEPEENEVFKCPCCHPLFGCTCGILDLSTLIRPDGTIIKRECKCRFNVGTELDVGTCKCCHVEWD